MNNNFMDSLEWQGNSKLMYRQILSVVPSLFVSTVNSSIQKWIIQNNIKVITEDIVFKAVNEIAPNNMSKKIIPELQKLRTT